MSGLFVRTPHPLPAPLRAIGCEGRDLLVAIVGASMLQKQPGQISVERLLVEADERGISKMKAHRVVKDLLAAGELKVIGSRRNRWFEVTHFEAYGWRVVDDEDVEAARRVVEKTANHDQKVVEKRPFLDQCPEGVGEEVVEKTTVCDQKVVEKRPSYDHSDRIHSQKHGAPSALKKKRETENNEPQIPQPPEPETAASGGGDWDCEDRPRSATFPVAAPSGAQVRPIRDIEPGPRNYEGTLWAPAFVRGMRAALGRAWGMPRTGITAIGDAVNTFAPDRRNADAWLEAEVRAYVAAQRTAEEFQPGRCLGPMGFLAWLNAGRPTASPKAGPRRIVQAGNPAHLGPVAPVAEQLARHVAKHGERYVYDPADDFGMETCGEPAKGVA